MAKQYLEEQALRLPQIRLFKLQQGLVTPTRKLSQTLLVEQRQ